MDCAPNVVEKTEDFFLSDDTKTTNVDVKCNLLPQREYIDLSEFAEQYSCSEKNENKFKTNPSCSDKTDSLPCASESFSYYFNNYVLPDSASCGKKLKSGDSNIDWIDNVIFDNSVVPQDSDIVALTSFDSQSMSKYAIPNTDYIQNYCPDLSDILDDSWEMPRYENVTEEHTKEGVVVETTGAGNVPTGNDSIYSDMKIEKSNNVQERRKKTSRKNTDFPGEISVFNVMESVDVAEVKSSNSLPLAMDAFSLAQPQLLYDDERRNWINFEETVLADGDYNCLWSESDELFPVIETIDTRFGEQLDDYNIEKFALGTDNNVTKISDSCHMSGIQYLINPDSLEANLILDNDGKSKLKASDQLLVNCSKNTDLKEKSPHVIIHPNKLTNSDLLNSSSVTQESVLSKQVVNGSLNTVTTQCTNSQSTSLILLINKNSAPNSQEHIRYKLPSKISNIAPSKPLLKSNLASTSAIPSNQQLLLLSTGEGQKYLLICNNQQPQLQKSENNQTPTIITLQESNCSDLSKKSNNSHSPTLATNTRLTKNGLVHLRIAENRNKISDESTSLSVNSSTKRRINLTPNVSVRRPYVHSNQSSIPSTPISLAPTPATNSSKIRSNIQRPFTPISVVPISPIVCSSTSTSNTSSQSQIVFLSKLGTSSNSKNRPIKSKSIWKSHVAPIKRYPVTIGQRKKTVRELLQDRRKKNILDSLIQNCLMDSDTAPEMISSDSTVPDILTPSSSIPSTSTSSKPSILMLHSDSSNSNNSDTSTLNFPTSNVISGSTSMEFEEIANKKLSYSGDTEDDVDDPEVCLEPIPDEKILPPFHSQRVDAKTFRPKHFDMFSLEIGNFKVSNEEKEGKVQCKFKILFTKRHFAYEFPLPSGDDTNDLKSMACIVVPFETLNAINCFDREVRIKVNCQPQTFLGSRQQRVGVICSLNVYNTNKLVDVTSGAAAKCSVHKVTLRQPYANRIKILLWEFDIRFKMLTSISIKEDTELLLPGNPAIDLNYTDDSDGGQSVKRSKKDTKLSVRRLPQSGAIEDDCFPKLQVCSCRISCRSMRCSCVKAAQKCNTGRSLCVCSNCDNPLNILDTIGIDPKLAVLDSCLFQNIYQVTHLRRYLCQEIKLPCCASVATVQECIPGTVLCPNTECMESVQFSWCRAMLCLAERNPRNHCNICGKCGFSIGYHCQNCNSCYIKRPRTPWCPKCTADPAVIHGERPLIPNDTSTALVERMLASNEWTFASLMD